MASVAPTFSDLSNTTLNVTITDSDSSVVGVASIAALRLVATSSDNIAAIVRDDGTGTLRQYQWVSTSTGADDGLSIVAPADGGTGRWILVF